MKSIVAIEETLHRMGKRARESAAVRYALSREDLNRFQKAIREARSSPKETVVGGQSGSCEMAHHYDSALSVNYLLDQIVADVSKKEPKRVVGGTLWLKGLGIGKPAQKRQLALAVSRYKRLRNKVTGKLAARTITTRQAKGQLLEAQGRLKADLIASGIFVKINP